MNNERKQREKEENSLKLYASALQEEMNLRLICSMETEDWRWGQVLWVEDVTLTDIRHPSCSEAVQNKRKGTDTYLAKARKYIFSKLMAKWKPMKKE